RAHSWQGQHDTADGASVVHRRDAVIEANPVHEGIRPVLSAITQRMPVIEDQVANATGHVPLSPFSVRAAAVCPPPAVLRLLYQKWRGGPAEVYRFQAGFEATRVAAAGLNRRRGLQ
ncbi:hypothetical protein D6779_04375, partial [Candidatus Parcubacteria bacterium]